MISGLVSLILLSTSSHIQSAEDPRQLPLTVAEPGGNVTLICVLNQTSWLVFWYKLTLGHMVQTIAKGGQNEIKAVGPFNNSRFTFERKDHPYTLTIGNVSKGDEATYLCQAGESHTMFFVNGSILAVRDREGQQTHRYSARQWPESVTVPPGHNTTLYCSLLSERDDKMEQCPACEHRVHWFRSAGPGLSYPGIIYTRRSGGGEQAGRRCQYTLSKTIHNSSDDGTYYCAVVTCGQILIGQGTKVETRQELLPVVIVLGTLLFCFVIVTVALILTRRKKSVCDHCKAGAATLSKPDGSAEGRSNDAVEETEAVTYTGLNFTSGKDTRWRSSNDFPEDCTYARTRNCQ